MKYEFDIKVVRSLSWIPVVIWVFKIFFFSFSCYLIFLKLLPHMIMLNAGVISGALLYIKDDFEVVRESYFLQVQALYCCDSDFFCIGKTNAILSCSSWSMKICC